MKRRGRPRHPDILTPREWEVLALLREGCSNEEIAERLDITLRTAKYHVSEIIGKLEVADRYEAAAWERRDERVRWSWAAAPFLVFQKLKWQSMFTGLGVALAAAALVLVALLGWGVSRTWTTPSASGDSICTPGPTYTPEPRAKGPVQINTPDLRPDSTRMADIEGGKQRRIDWSARYIAAGCDPHSLSPLAIGIDDPFGTYGRTFQQSVVSADFIITGRVTKTTFSIGAADAVMPLAAETIAVDRVVKGGVPNTIVLHQGGGPMRDNGGSLVSFPADPVLLHGDHVLLFGNIDQSTGAYAQEYPLGKFYIRDGKVYAADQNPCNGMDGMTVGDAVALIMSAADVNSHVSAADNICDWSRFE